MVGPESRRSLARRTARRGHDESGSATVLALGVIVAVLTVTIGGLAVMGSLRSVHVARSAADLAALAAAGDFQQHADPVGACRAARRIARGQAAQLVGCTIDARGIATVTTSVPISHHVAGLGPDAAEGRARAGPG